MGFPNKFERRFDRYVIHNLMYYTTIMYIMDFVIMYMGPVFFTRRLNLDTEAILHGQVWRLVMFLLYPPTLGPFQIIFTALMYYLLGRSLEAVQGAFCFNMFLFMGAIGTILAELIVCFIWGWDMHLNTSYLSMSILLAYAVIFPEEYFYIYFVLAIKAKWLALFDAFSLVFGFVYGSFLQRITIFLSIANFIILLLIAKDFEKYSPRKVKHEQDLKVKTMRPVSRTHHKYMVCGRTDEESSGMEFRYCSKCRGSYEHYVDHLYTHQHVRKLGSLES